MMNRDDRIDDAVLAILSALHADANCERGHKQRSNYAEPGMSLAKLSKRVEQRMSTLRRHLSALEDAEIVRVALNEDGTGRAALTAFGMAIVDALDERQAAEMA
ncbi:Helix-turn-helix domain-containing protein [Collimonas sp. OK242]|jgi:DNA-binding transcriptional ArsR family regulator|uniref:helix-turn-helix domain-containing protein n=1 Tax=Collimonas sp. OK242 TaxID=1798195 RepID=UPI00089951EA|nr:helix-turn-helix domain-containing protein [Collimonas sp. OK242]SDY01949.1 Helix-turn-helix domain-containing protein [Collimonas sp. OK242]